MKKIKFNWVKIVTVMLLAVLVVIVGLMYTKLVELTSQIAYLQDTTNIILTDVGGLETGIAQTLEAETSMVENYSIEITDMNFRKQTYDVAVTLIPKEYTDNTKVSVFFGTYECALEKDGYSYRGTISLPLAKSFDGNLTFLFADGKKKNTEVYSNYEGLNNHFSEVLSGRVEEVPEYKDGTFTFEGTAAYTLEGFGKYEFDSFELVALWDEKELYCQNLIAPDTSDDQRGETTEPGPGTEAVEVPQERETAFLGSQGAASFEFSYEPEDAGALRLFLRAITTEGYRFEYDLFGCELTKESESDEAVDEMPEFVLEEAGFDRTPYYVAYDRRGNRLELEPQGTAETE